MTKAQSKAYLLAGVAVVLAALTVAARSFTWHKLNALGIAGKSVTDPAVTAALDRLRITERISWATLIAGLICLQIAFRLHWERAWQPWALVIVVLASVLFSIFGDIRW